MTAVFVHGVPETPILWDPLVAALGADDAIRLQLPGFGCPLPDGFDPTMYGYAEWMAAELAGIGSSVDLVTHDWGALLGLRVLAEHPTLVRSWVTDGGDLDDDFEWHDTARIWQTPGEGEAFMDGLLSASVADRAALLAGLGVGEPTATELAAAIDATMGEAILVLYRSATGIGPEWGPGIDSIVAPTLIVEAGQDPYRSEGASARLAERLDASTVRLADQGHWWMVGDPAAAATVIEAFWAGLD